MGAQELLCLFATEGAHQPKKVRKKQNIELFEEELDFPDVDFSFCPTSLGLRAHCIKMSQGLIATFWSSNCYFYMKKA